MISSLPAPVAGFFQAHDTSKTGNFLDLFTTKAVVSDDSHEYRGEAVRTWIDGANASFHPLHAEVVSLEEDDSLTVATAQVSGAFPGSPVPHRYQFALRNDRIAALSIAP